MPSFFEWVRRLEGLLGRGRTDADLEDELRAHLAIAADEATRQRSSRAGRAGVVTSEGVTQTMAALREQRSLPWFEDLSRDVYDGVRALRKQPGSTAVAMLSLALAFGAAAAVLSLADALFDRDLPVQAPQDLVVFSRLAPNDSGTNGPGPLLFSQFEDLAAHVRDFSAVFAWRDDQLRNLQTGDVRYLGAVNSVSGEYFAALGVEPLLGRLITPADVGHIGGTSARIAVLDYRAWQSHFGGDPHVLGKTLIVDGTTLTIVGVTPEHYLGLNIELAPEASAPIGFELDRIPDHATPGMIFSYYVGGRLKPRTTIHEAAGHMASAWPAVLAATAPVNQSPEQRSRFLSSRIEVRSLSVGTTGSGEFTLRPMLRQPVADLTGLALLVLIVACVNLANLILSRAVSRTREMAVRASLGAGRGALVRATVVEGVLVAGAGATLGVLGAFWTAPLLYRGLMGGEFGYGANTFDARPDMHVLFWAAVASVTVGVFCSMVPAWRAIGANPAALLSQQSRVVRGAGARFQKVLVVAQVALGVVLAMSALLFGRSLRGLYAVDPGFRADDVHLLSLFPQTRPQDMPDRTAYFQAMTNAVLALPGVSGVSFGTPAPFVGEDIQTVSGLDLPNGLKATVTYLGPGFLRTLGMRLLAGRDFDWHDDEHGPLVALISESFAREISHGGDVIGHAIDVDGRPAQTGKGLRIIGIVSDASLGDLRHRAPRAVYTAIFQLPTTYSDSPMEIRAAGNDADLMAAANRVIEPFGRQYVFRAESLGQTRTYALRNDRLISALAGFFGTLTVLLAAAGLYGLLAYAVTLRRPEIGLRMALGAGRRNVLFMVMRDAASLLAVGVCLGVPIAFAVGRAASARLFGLTPTDPLTLALSVAGIAIIGGAAALVPARRAAALDPLTALRRD